MILKHYNVLGTMSGTAFDGIDFSYLYTDGDALLEFKGDGYVPYPEHIIGGLLRCNSFMPVIDMLLLEKDVTAFYGKMINEFLHSNNFKKPDFIAFHGQTVIHDPNHGITVQLGCPLYLSQLCGIKVVSDFRKGDILGGGQGAPIVPIYHLYIAKKFKKNMAIINLGGIANITWVANNMLVAAVDSGPGIGLIDQWIHAHDASIWYDEGGQMARMGKVNYVILDLLLSDPYFAFKNAKSLDKNYFSIDSLMAKMNMQDGAATLVEFTALAIKKAFQYYLNHEFELVVLCGGGRKNLFLKERINLALGIKTLDIDDLGFNGDSTEAEAMAYIAARAMNCLDFTFPSTTGVKQPQGYVRETFYPRCNLSATIVK